MGIQPRASEDPHSALEVLLESLSREEEGGEEVDNDDDDDDDDDDDVVVDDDDDVVDDDDDEEEEEEEATGATGADGAILASHRSRSSAFSGPSSSDMSRAKLLLVEVSIQFFISKFFE